MTSHDALLPTTVLQRKAVVYVRQSTPQQVQSNLESQRRQYELVDVQGGAASPTSRSSMTISVVLRVARLTDRGLTGWLLLCAPARLGPCSASMPHGSPAMAATGIICWSCVDWWMPVSSTSMACTTRAGQMIVTGKRPPPRHRASGLRYSLA